MRWLLTFFQRKTAGPSHEEIQAKVQRIQSGEDRASRIVHNQKRQYTNDLLKMRNQAKIVRREAEKMVKLTDTAISIAIASGSLQ